MFSKQQLVRRSERFVDGGKLAAKHILLEQLLADPERHGLTKRREPARRESKVSFEQPLEFKKWLVVKRDAIDLPASYTPFGNTPAYCVCRKTGVMLVTSKTFLLCRSHDNAVAHQGCGAIMIVGRYSKDDHCD